MNKSGKYSEFAVAFSSHFNDKKLFIKKRRPCDLASVYTSKHYSFNNFDMNKFHTAKFKMQIKMAVAA